MKNYIAEANANVHLQEGSRVIEQLLVECYIHPGISTKELAKKTFLPVPVATAIKKELIKAGALTQDSGVRCTPEGVTFIEDELGYGGLDKALYQKLMANDFDWKAELSDLLQLLTDIFQQRPQVNVQIDQSKCTVETSMRRAILCLREHALIGKKIICVGDDDLVSISLGFLIKKLFPNIRNQRALITVVDVDERFLQYIRNTAEQEGIEVICRSLDLRQPLPKKLCGQYDCFFTDPPYTLQGMTLFVSRGISALKKEKGLPIFLSYAHKSPDYNLAILRELVRMGLSLREIIPHFNKYEGAQMIGNSGQMIILKTTELTEPIVTCSFEDALYTGEVKRTLRTYQCKQCHGSLLVGIQGEFHTIEDLKNQGCPHCENDTFTLIAKKNA
ncbi:bis-aminopropyl spermidine synthase family protein [Paenibacillus sp. N3/727]|uniref:bis-aminopropyl spermidine synthase family protein n=1 Tax=Paenibacillus sp. N3/727 TaxID=2925845 RepID=UPI001F534121|nr:bis-aminopropyl spermidine synthase family protein [Paenibacillus sp. N3/727]UNK19945.1 bis-aminopropyl spermidine synthase family protein [Paenibacillus sp. N3/727]